MMIQLCYENRLTGYTVERFLRELGHEVIACDKTKERSCEIGMDTKLAIVELYDLSLREMKWITEIHAQNPAAPIILIVEPRSIINALNAIALGVHTCLRKPLRLSELELAIHWLEKVMEEINRQYRWKF